MPFDHLQIVRDQCWINETLKATNWTAEELMPDAESDGDEADTMCTPEAELDALLKGKYFIQNRFSYPVAAQILSGVAEH